MPAKLPAIRPETSVGPRAQTDRNLRRSIQISAVLVLAVAAVGFLARIELETLGLARPRIGELNVFQVLFFRLEPIPLAVLAGFALMILVFGRGSSTAAREGRGAPRLVRTRFVVAVAAGAVFAGAALGSRAVFRGYPLAMDEFAATFQARIFEHGSMEAAVPPGWQRYVFAMQPVFIEYKPATHVWLQGYLPGYAACRALLGIIGVEAQTNAILAGLSVLLVAAVARRLWPDRGDLILLSVLFLITSSQFLLTSASVAYSMPAHLCLNLLWLYLHLSPEASREWLAVPWVGALALGLHNPFPHALFVAPFFLRLLRRRQGRKLVYWILVYGAAAVGWYGWLHHSFFGISGTPGFGKLFGLPAQFALFPRMGGVLVLTWQTPIVAILVLLAFVRWNSLSAVGRDLLLGIVVTLVFYFFFPMGQGHGWGYRFVHGVLGNLALLAVFAVQHFQGTGQRWIRTMITASALTSLVVLIPLRAHQAYAFTKPFADAAAYVRGYPAEVVTIDRFTGWYFQDLVRNDPFLEKGPKIMFAERVSAAMRRDLERRTPKLSIHDMRPEELGRFGIPWRTQK